MDAAHLDRGHRFQAFPFTPIPERAEVVSRILRSLAKLETVFTGYQTGCDDECGACDVCLMAMRTASRFLSAPDARAWEVWKLFDDSRSPELSGVVRLSEIQPGISASLQYAFFDGRLKDKTPLLEDLIQWAFDAHEDWLPLQRVSLDVPDYAHALARHATKALGFGGPFSHALGERERPLSVEGVRANAIWWRGVPRSLLLLGRMNPLFDNQGK